MILSLIHRLKAENLPLPRCIVAISPWTDLTHSGASHQYNKSFEICLTTERLQNYADAYGGDNLRSPLVSPAFGDFSGFPPILIFAGGDEILLDDSRAVLRGCIKANVSCRLIIEKGMWHGYPLYPTVESAKAMDCIADFINNSFDEKE